MISFGRESAAEISDNWVKVGNFGYVKIADWVSIAEAAEALNLTTTSVRDWAKLGKIKTLRKRKQPPYIYVSISDIEEHLARRKRIKKRRSM